MAKKQLDFYRGRRKKRNFAIVPTVIILLFFGVAVVLFYSTQKYAIIADDGVSVDLPFLSGGRETSSVEEEETVVYETVDASVEFLEADYSEVQATAGDKVKPVRAIYIPYEDVNEESISAYADRLSSGNALLMNVKQKNGYLAWYSDAPIAYSYGLNMVATDTKEKLVNVLSELKDRKIYLIAQISCCMDELLGAHSTEVCIKNEFGMYYYDEFGYWLDPYSTIVRNYTVQLVQELWDMGFDEVVLQDLAHPAVQERENPDGSFTKPISYTREMSTDPTPQGGISGFAVYVADQLSNRDDGKFLSAYLNSSTALTKTDTTNGQDGRLFLKVFDRVYYETDKYAYNFNVDAVTPACTRGNVKNRFVPVVINYLPDNTSWVLVDRNEG